MAKGVFVHRSDSKYDDFPEEQYQFPKRYLSRVQATEHDWIVYYEPSKGAHPNSYTAIARMDRIERDPNQGAMYIARIAPGTYLPFEQPVFFRSSNGFMESELEKPDGSLNGGKIQWAIRPISDADFNAIVLRGLPEEADVLPRSGDVHSGDAGYPALAEDAADFEFERPRVEQTITRSLRDRVFRRLVLEAYDSRCAITGLRLINGGGRAEVEAAHIRPVKHNGPDTIRNGIALSGTVHWMFDRGLIALSDDLDILVSRQVNDPDQVWSLVRSTGKAVAPENPAHRPHPRYLGWHREFCFKG